MPGEGRMGGESGEDGRGELHEALQQVHHISTRESMKLYK
jgi:hypothetical protein